MKKIIILKRVSIGLLIMCSNICYSQIAKPVDPLVKTPPIGNPVIVKPGTIQQTATTNLSNPMVTTNMDIILEAKNDVANAKPTENLGETLGGGKEMQLNQVLKSYIPNSGKYATLSLTKSNLQLSNGNDKLVWSSSLNTLYASKLVMQADGNLVLRSIADGELWSTRTKGAPNAKLLIRATSATDLELRVVDSTKLYRYYWSSIYKNKPWAYVSKGSKSLCSNQMLRLRTDSVESIDGPNTMRLSFEPVNEPDQFYTSTSYLAVRSTVTGVTPWLQNIAANENAIAIMKPDGNFGVYTDLNHLNTPLWETKTAGNNGACLVMPESGKESIIMINKNGQTIWTPKGGASDFKNCEATVTIKTGSDDKVDKSYVSATLYSDINIDNNQKLPILQTGNYSNYGSSITNEAYPPNSTNKFNLDKTRGIGTKDQSLKNFEDKGGRLELTFSPATIFLANDHWTINSIELNLTFKDQFGNTVVKVISFAHSDITKLLVRLGDEYIIHDQDPEAIICCFDKNFRPTDFKTFRFINDKESKLETFQY